MCGIVGFLDNGQNDNRNQDVIPLEWMGKRQNIARGELNKTISEHLGVIFDSISQQLKDFKAFRDLSLTSGEGRICGECKKRKKIMVPQV